MYANAADIEILRGPFQTDPYDEAPAAIMLLEMASARLRRDVRDLDTNIAAGKLDAALPKWVVCRMVIDVLNNPERYTTEGILDATYRFDPQMVRNQMKPTDDELESLKPLPEVRRRAPGGTITVRPWCP